MDSQHSMSMMEEELLQMDGMADEAEQVESPESGAEMSARKVVAQVAQSIMLLVTPTRAGFESAAAALGWLAGGAQGGTGQQRLALLLLPPPEDASVEITIAADARSQLRWMLQSRYCTHGSGSNSNGKNTVCVDALHAAFSALALGKSSGEAESAAARAALMASMEEDMAKSGAGEDHTDDEDAMASARSLGNGDLELLLRTERTAARFAYLSICLPFCFCCRLSDSLSVCLSVCLCSFFVCISICLSPSLSSWSGLGG
jgi:hypothetical protein